MAFTTPVKQPGVTPVSTPPQRRRHPDLDGLSPLRSVQRAACAAASSLDGLTDFFFAHWSLPACEQDCSDAPQFPSADAWEIALSPQDLNVPRTPSKLPVRKSSAAASWTGRAEVSVWSRRERAKQDRQLQIERNRQRMARRLPTLRSAAAASWQDRMRRLHDTHHAQLDWAKQQPRRLAAAVLLQRHWRGALVRLAARRLAAAMLLQNRRLAAAELVQRHWRGALVRRAARLVKEAMEDEARAHRATVARAALEAALEWLSRAEQFAEAGRDERAEAACQRAADKVRAAAADVQNCGCAGEARAVLRQVALVRAVLERRRGQRERDAAEAREKRERELAQQREKQLAQAQSDLRRAHDARDRGDFDTWEAAANAAHRVLSSEGTAQEVALVASARARPEMLALASRVLMDSRAGRPHAALGIPHHAPPRAVRKAYKSLAMQLHPDKNDGHPGAKARAPAHLSSVSSCPFCAFMPPCSADPPGNCRLISSVSWCAVCEAAFKALQDVYDAIKRRASYQAQL